MNNPTTPSRLLDYQAAPDLLKQRIILVTGAGDGIGKAVALGYARHGATVILAGRTVPKLEQTYDQIVAEKLAEPIIYPVDLLGATLDNFHELNNLIDEQFGRLDGLLHNAAILGQRTPLSNYRNDVWDKVIQANLSAQFLMTQALMPSLEQSDDASVIFTTSSVGRVGRAYWGAYAISKFAIEGLVQTWADELDGLGPVRVNALNPGGTRTNMRAQAYPAEDPTELTKPEALLPAYLWLMGPDSKGVSGQSLDAQPKK